MKTQIYGVIIAGGKGTRFWPLSRARRPKQLLKILGRDSLIRETAARLLPICGAERTLVVTVAEQLTALRGELRALPRSNFLAEPRGNNTAPCIGLAALEVSRREPEAVMAVLPADHWISDVAAFRRTLKAAAGLAARENGVVTVGVRPDYPETGYGYILKGRSLGKTAGARAYGVRRFKEKPSVAEARRLIRRGSLWNAGIFVWRASVLLDMMRRYHPPIAAGLEKIGRAAEGRSLANPAGRLRAAIAREYKKMPSLSIDHAVLEKAGADGRVATLEANFGWSDVGSWAAVHRALPRDRDGNAGRGRWLAFEAHDCLIQTSDRLVALLGVRDTAVIDTPDALLVCDLKRSQEVRELVEALKRKGYGAYTVK